MTDTAREPIAYLWQHKETGRVYYQGPHDEAPQSTYALIGPLFLEPSAIPPREATDKMIEAGADDFLAVTEHAYAIFSRDLASVWRAMYDAAIAEKEGK